MAEKTRIEILIETVEAAFAAGNPYAYVETGQYKGCTAGTVRALARRGYRIERRVLGGAYHVYPKPKAPVVEKTYKVELTESEIIVIRELVRKFPRGGEFAQDYAEEFRTLDKKTTDKLADIFDAHEGLKKN